MIDLGGVGGAKRTGSLGIGRAAEHLPDHLCDGVTVDAVDFEQVGHFAAAGNVSDSQMLESEAGLIDDSGAHRFSQATCGITAGKHVNGPIFKEYHTKLPFFERYHLNRHPGKSRPSL